MLGGLALLGALPTIGLVVVPDTGAIAPVGGVLFRYGLLTVVGGAVSAPVPPASCETPVLVGNAGLTVPVGGVVGVTVAKSLLALRLAVGYGFTGVLGALAGGIEAGIAGGALATAGGTELAAGGVVVGGVVAPGLGALLVTLFKLTPGKAFGSVAGDGETGVAAGTFEGVGGAAAGNAGKPLLVAGVFWGPVNDMVGGVTVGGTITGAEDVAGGTLEPAGTEFEANVDRDGGNCTWGAVSQWPASDGGDELGLNP